MKKTKIDRSIDTEALGFQVRESYKTARTNIAYSIFKKGCKKVAFTSSTKGEGKTVTSINVASALAQQVGTKVIVVECDLRRPRVNTALKITPTPGLTNYLNEECSLEDIVKDTKIENLKAITYGAIPPKPVRASCE
ncbi:MAG TPA: CpsD/CapB family tyrosine-protein kinase [Ruminococcus bromii]|nr:CpsD/CapB family tyrosine-protein kinase [Ruminococcus bromii]